MNDCGAQEKPVNAFLPLFWAFIILCMLAGLRLTYQAIYKTSAFRSAHLCFLIDPYSFCSLDPDRTLDQI